MGCQSKHLPFTKGAKLDHACVLAGREFWKGSSHTPDEIDAFYSDKLDTCVQVEIDNLAWSYMVRDVTHGFMRDTPLLLYCDRDGADNAVIENVRKFNGYTYTVEYKLWLDDGNGGPPRTLKTPEKPWTRDQCQAVLDKKLAEIR